MMLQVHVFFIGCMRFHLVYRSCGYQWRPSIPVREIKRLCDHVRKVHHGVRVQDTSSSSLPSPSPPVESSDPSYSRTTSTSTSHRRYTDDKVLVFVDNCYGELVEEQEPCHVGADLVAGSLIKNLGGTLAPCGGYVAGNR